MVVASLRGKALAVAMASTLAALSLDVAGGTFLGAPVLGAPVGWRAAFRMLSFKTPALIA
jgi:predicted MFS family arabinose efflux permease